MARPCAGFATFAGPRPPHARPGPTGGEGPERDPRRANEEESTVLYLAAVATLAALIYLAYAMIRPESF